MCTRSACYGLIWQLASGRHARARDLATRLARVARSRAAAAAAAAAPLKSAIIKVGSCSCSSDSAKSLRQFNWFRLTSGIRVGPGGGGTRRLSTLYIIAAGSFIRLARRPRPIYYAGQSSRRLSTSPSRDTKTDCVRARLAV